MRKNLVCCVMLMVVSVFPLFAGGRKRITVRQFIAYMNGRHAELNTPQISKSKALQTGNGKILLRYDFHVNSPWPYGVVLCFIFFPKDISVSATAIDGANAYTFDEVLEEDDDLDNYIAEDNRIVPVFNWDDNSNVLGIIIPPEKEHNARIEFELDVSEWNARSIPVDIEFHAKWDVSIAKSYVRGLFLVPAIIDVVQGNFADNPFETSNCKFTLLVSE